MQRADLPVYSIELVYGNRTADIPPGPGVIHVPSSSYVWPREKLLDILESHVPAHYTKV